SRGAAACGGAGPAHEVVGHDRLVSGRLIEMAMGVDPARQDEKAAGVDLAPARGKVRGEGGDAPVPNADVRSINIDGGRRRPAPDHEIERGHRFPLLYSALFLNFACKIMNDAA